MWPLGKKFIEPGQEPVVPDQPKREDSMPGPSDSSGLTIEITKLKAQFDQFSELRKVFNERFTRINEQIGELRGMITDSNRAMQDVEVKVVKSVDLVEAVHPDKLMVEVRKQDAKIEALKANIESNEAMMKSILDQLKDMRHQISAFRGVDQVVKLNEEVKKELLNIKKIEATVERHADKIEGIFIESQKRFQDFEKLGDRMGEIERQLKATSQQSDESKVKLQATANKKELENLITKFNDFEKHMANIIDLITRRSNELPKDINHRFKHLEESMNKAFDQRLSKAEKFSKMLTYIENNTPKIAEELKIAEALKDTKDAEISVGKSAVADENKQVEQERKGFFSKIFKKKAEDKPAQ